MSESIALKRSQRSSHAEAEPRRRSLGASPREIRELMRKEAETQSLAAMHRLRLLRKLDAVTVTFNDGMTLFMRTIAQLLLKEEGSISEELAHATLSHVLSAGLHALCHAMEVGGPVALAAGVGLHLVMGQIEARREGMAQEHLLRVADLACGEARDALRVKINETRAYFDSRSNDELAAHERALLARHAVYETSPEYASVGMLDLADDMFLESVYVLPETGSPAALTVALKMTIAFDAAMADLHHRDDPAAQRAEYAEGRARMALVPADEGLGYSERARSERADRRRLGGGVR